VSTGWVDPVGLQHIDLADLNYALRHNINSVRGYQRPIDLAFAHYARKLTTASDRLPGGSKRAR
jgi:hypothetical protein